jgi:predicted hotdog family 3-hydroxylacyl-ACP dehydratase
MLIDKGEIARMIPHAGDMCLLEGVLSWDSSRIRCVTATHRQRGNPLLRDGRLGILCGVEYAAQAMALHAALVGGGDTEAPWHGYLASLRAVSCHVDRLDQIQGALLVEAERLLGEAGRMIYAFALRHEDRLLLDGRAAVALQQSITSSPSR